ncbi:MAG: hypothetical protein GY697_20270, partial [Desulfobacterales bacterium]|nr:hypothetical protein [Desulfobacterales bacterium]
MMKSRDPQNYLVEQIEGFESVIRANDRNTIIRHGGDRGRVNFLPETFLSECPLAVLDAETVQLIQVLPLHQAIDHTQSATGSAALLRSLLQPSKDLAYIHARQDALREIAANDNLRRVLQDCVYEYSRGENALYKFFNKGLYALFPYQDTDNARKAAVNIVRTVKDLPSAESVYLQALFSYLRTYQGSEIDQMMRGAICKTLAGLQSSEAVGILTPKLKFAPRRFTLWMLAGPLVALAPHIQGKIGFDQMLPPLVAHVGYALTGILLLYGLFFKPARDTFNFIEPFREKCIADAAFNRAVDTLGSIDELLSWDTFAREVPRGATLPQVRDELFHAFDATGLMNPVLSGDKPDFVANDVHLKGVRLTFISGPNSGGKTTICKSIAQSQLLAQAGGYILAEKATI